MSTSNIALHTILNPEVYTLIGNTLGSQRKDCEKFFAAKISSKNMMQT
jgi:hypothetical protein